MQGRGGLVLVLCLVPTLAWGARQDLDEAMARKARYSTATKYTGEEAPNYQWQPETLTWTDTTTGKEVWRLTLQPSGSDKTSKEHAGQAWSGDGSRLGFWDGSKRDPSNPSISGGNSRSERRWIVNADGSGLRGSDGSGLYNMTLSDFDWLHTERASYISFSSHEVLEGYSVTTLLKSTVDGNNHATNAVLFDTSTTDSTIKYSIKGAVSGTDEFYTVRNTTEDSTTDPNTSILSSTMYSIDLSTNSVVSHWGVGRDIGTFGDSHQSSYETRFHDAWAIGTDGAWMMGDYSTGDIFALFKMRGSSSDGGPSFSAWDGDSWGVTGEVKIVFDGGNTYDNPYGLPYAGHPTIDQWGRYALLGTYTDPQSSAGTRILDIRSIIDSDNGTFEAAYPLHKSIYDGQHHSWSGWTDYVVGVNPTAAADIKTGAYNSETATTVVTTDFPGYYSNYNIYPRPVQSPDGTKVVFSHALFVSDYSGTSTADHYTGLSWAVAYYPHPPEITSVTGSETYTIRFDWRTDQSVSRGYTQRGWPDEATDDPPPPRETKLFRLWRSANGTDGWVPVGTVNADIFSRYNFATGDWTGNKYWEISDTPGAGTWYYAVTAQEHSGIESRTLSNVFNTAGTQTAAYPSDPKGDSDFATVYNPTTVRHYNIYAADGAAPTATQQDRIASIPVAAAGEYVDWLGGAAGTTQYLVTAVDTQGNESSAIDGVTRTALATPGQYRLQWGHAVPRRLSLSGSLIKLAEPGP